MILLIGILHLIGWVIAIIGIILFLVWGITSYIEYKSEKELKAIEERLENLEEEL